MASLMMVKNPLAPADRATFTLGPGDRPIDWLQAHYPTGCGGQVHYFVNGERRPLDDLDYQPEPDDVIVLAVQPADPTGGILTALLISAVVTGLSMLVGVLFARPKPPAFTAADAAQPSPVYSVRSNQNTARLGEVVPVHYGNVLHTPDICAQPYKFYLANQDEYFDMLLCLGEGDFSVQQVLVGDTDANDIGNAGFQWYVAPPSVHGGALGNLATVFNPPFHENMLTSSEVGEQEFIREIDVAGWFRLGRAGQTGRYILVDIFYPTGLFQIMEDGVTQTGTQVFFELVVQEADPDGHPLPGTQQVFGQNQDTVNGKDPLRMSYTFDTGRSANWLVLMSRKTPQYPSGGEVNRYVWTGLRLLIDSFSGPAYGNTTLMACRFRATAVSSSANNQVRVRVQRNLPLLGSGPSVATNSPADAFVDMMTNTDYGARRPLSEVDVGRLAALKNFWALGGHQYDFNAIYTGRSTVWEALDQAMQVVGATALPLGSLMSVAQDGIKTFRTMLFSDQNVSRDSFHLTYSFALDGDNDGVEVEYRDPLTFAPAVERWPDDSADPEKITLFGCTDLRQAADVARLLWQRKIGNRRAVAFETEMEGLIPVLGERTAIAHTLPRWGQSGFVIDVSGLAVTLDRNLVWDDPLLVPPYVITFRDEFSGMSKVVQCARGPTDNVAILASDPWLDEPGDWSLVNTQERTHFAFGDGTRVVKDFILSKIAPRDDKRVAVSGVYYDPTVYDGTFAFMAYPVP